MRGRVEREAGAMLDEQVKRVAEAGGDISGAHAKVGRPDAEIVRLAEELGTGLIVWADAALEASGVP